MVQRKDTCGLFCMETCIYDLIVGNDVFQNGVGKYSGHPISYLGQEQEKSTKTLIFENSKFSNSRKSGIDSTVSTTGMRQSENEDISPDRNCSTVNAVDECYAEHLDTRISQEGGKTGGDIIYNNNSSLDVSHRQQTIGPNNDGHEYRRSEQAEVRPKRNNSVHRVITQYTSECAENHRDDGRDRVEIAVKNSESSKVAEFVSKRMPISSDCANSHCRNNRLKHGEELLTKEKDSERDKSLPEIAAVQTRAQRRVEQDNSEPRPLKNKQVDELEIDYEGFKNLQENDESLAKFWELARQQKDAAEDKVRFEIRRDCCIAYSDLHQGLIR